MEDLPRPMAPAPVVIAAVKDVEVAAGTKTAKSAPKVDQNRRKVIKLYSKNGVACFSRVELLAGKNANGSVTREGCGG